VARRANYGFEKRQNEINRQKKKEEKAEKKRLKRESGDQPDPTDSATEENDASGSPDTNPLTHDDDEAA
jgi:hypothetical protein